MEIEPLIKQLLTELGENPEREGLVRTPHRVAEAWKFLTRGYTQDIDKVINGALFKADAQHLVICKDIEIYSVCEHHMLPFFGRCHIGYIPRDKVIGVSKLARIADMFSRRLQIQERLTEQIAQCLMTHLNPLGVGVVIEARHLCMMMRGVEKQNSNMISSALLGCFQTPATRAEFFQLIERPSHHT